jgi:hypothetical protein
MTVDGRRVDRRGHWLARRAGQLGQRAAAWKVSTEAAVDWGSGGDGRGGGGLGRAEDLWRRTSAGGVRGGTTSGGGATGDGRRRHTRRSERWGGEREVELEPTVFYGRERWG